MGNEKDAIRRCPNCNGCGKVMHSMSRHPQVCGRCDGRGTIPDEQRQEARLIVSPSGATETCSECGTMYDRHELVGYVPPYGDGCDFCAPDPFEEDDLNA